MEKLLFTSVLAALENHQPELVDKIRLAIDTDRRIKMDLAALRAAQRDNLDGVRREIRHAI